MGSDYYFRDYYSEYLELKLMLIKIKKRLEKLIGENLNNKVLVGELKETIENLEDYVEGLGIGTGLLIAKKMVDETF